MLRKLRASTYGKHLITIICIVLSALLQTFALKTFINAAHLLPSGFVGVATLLNKILFKFGINFPIHVGIVVLNLPVALMCIKGISLRFTLYSLGQVFLSSIFIKYLHFAPIFDDVLLNVIFGGFIYGFTIALALKGNASTGGTDFIALYISNKTGKSIWYQVFTGNVIMLVIYGVLFGWENAGYSILFQFISTRTISTFHLRYERVTLQITTQKSDDVIKAYLDTCNHGISCVKAKGGYSGEDMYLLHAVVSSYEMQDVITSLVKADPNIIINVLNTAHFVGRFRYIPIE